MLLQGLVKYYYKLGVAKSLQNSYKISVMQYQIYNHQCAPIYYNHDTVMGCIKLVLELKLQVSYLWQVGLKYVST